MTIDGVWHWRTDSCLRMQTSIHSFSTNNISIKFSNLCFWRSYCSAVGLFDTTQFLKWFYWKMIKDAVVEVSWLTKQISRRDLFSKYICCILWTYWILQNIFYISVCLSVCPFFKILPFRSQWCVSPSPHERFSVYNLYISEPPAMTQWHNHVRRRRTFWHYLALKYAQ